MATTPFTDENEDGRFTAGNRTATVPTACDIVEPTSSEEKRAKAEAEIENAKQKIMLKNEQAKETKEGAHKGETKPVQRASRYKKSP